MAEEEPMPTPYCERAIEDALRYGKAILKFISPNDADVTGGHQRGYYLPKTDGVWEIYTQVPPKKGVNDETSVSVVWQDGRTTASCIKWYGKEKSEYRLTTFGKDFPYRTADSVGDLLVLIPKSYTEFNAYVLFHDTDIDQIQAALGVDIVRTWAAYVQDAPDESEQECVDRHFRDFVKSLTDWPKGKVFSTEAQKALINCIDALSKYSADRKLIEFTQAEFKLFRIAERYLCGNDIVGPFKDIDDFLKTAKRIMQRRVRRAGGALENHFEYLLKDAQIPYKMQPTLDGRPDVVIPCEDAYNDPSYPLDKLFVVGIKTTCKDRWRQVIQEGKRQPNKHLVTLQPAISGGQLQQMHEAGLTLVVPNKYHKAYPKVGNNATVMGVENFLDTIKRKLEA